MTILKKIVNVVLVTVTGFGLILFLSGCDRSYLPWVRNPWPSHNRVVLQQPVLVAQEPIENFCADMKKDIDIYRDYLNPNYVWDIGHSSVIRRRRQIRLLVEQYDRMCI